MWHPKILYIVTLKLIGEGKDTGSRKAEKYLAIHSQITVKAISGNISIMNTGISPGPYWEYLVPYKKF